MPVTIDGSNTPTAGGIGYGDGTELAFTNAGTAGQVLKSNGAGAPTWGSSTVNLATDVTGTLPVGNGGTGQTSLTSNNVILGNGGSAVQFVAPGANGNVLTSNGTTWTSAAASGGLTLLSTVTASSSSTVDIETGIGSSYDFYLITLQDVVGNADGNYIAARLKVDGSYQTSSYVIKVFGGYPNSSMAVYGTTSESGIPITLSAYSYTGSGLQTTVWFSNPTSTSRYKKIYFDSIAAWGSTDLNALTGGGFYGGSTGALTGIRFYFTSGVIVSGTFRLYGYAK